MPEITVAISAYNLGRYIGECLAELEGQTFRDFGVLIVNDCSTDDTVRIINECAASMSVPVRLISTPENTGKPGLARNYALDSGLIDGRYLIFLDGDDKLEPDLLEKLHTAAIENDADIAVCAYDRFEDETGHVLCREMIGFPPTVDIPPDSDILAFVNGSLWNKLIRTDIIGDARIPDFKVGEDMCFALGLYGKCRRVCFIDDMLIHYRVHSGSVISNTDRVTIQKFSEEMHRLLEENKDSSELYEVIALVTFIHIGISMAMRAYDNKSIDNKVFIKENKRYLSENDILYGRKYLGFSSLLKHGVRGIAIRVCLVSYRLGTMLLFLRMYNAMKKIFKIDVKF